MADDTSTRIADDAHSAPATQPEPEELGEGGSAIAGALLVTAMEESEANIQPEGPAESSDSYENISVPSCRSSLDRKSGTHSFSLNLGGSVLDGPIVEDTETDRDGLGEQDVAAPGSPSYQSTAFPANEGGADAADSTGDNRGEAEGNATAEEITAERGEAEGNVAADDDITAASRGGPEGDAQAQDTTSENRGGAEGNAAAEDTTAASRGVPEGDATDSASEQAETSSR